MTPMERFLWWINERESIRLKKEAGEPRPWTADPILQKYRFCNVMRIDDAVSQWLLYNWYEPYRDHPNMLAAVALARFFNLPSSLEAITDRVFRKGRPDWAGIRKRLRKLKERGTVFNAAYMVRGNDGPDKVDSVVTHNVMPLFRSKVQINPSSMRKTWEQIVPQYGFGSFMAGQIVADLRWALTGEWEDRYEWAPMGPGSLRGMNRVLGLPVDAPCDQETFLNRLQGWMLAYNQELPEHLRNRIEAMDWQNCLCEFSGYEKTRLGEGRKKETYQGPGVKYGGRSC